MGVSFWYPLFPIFLASSGLDLVQVGIVFALGSATSIIGIPLGGYAGDVVGRKATIVLAGAVVCFGTGSLALSPRGLAAVSYSLVMLGTTFGSGATQALLIESSPKGKRGSAMASPLFLPSLAGIPMPLLGAVVGQAVGWSVVFGVSTVLLATSVVGRQIGLSETMEQDGRPPKLSKSPRFSVIRRLAILSPIALVASVYLLDGFSEGSYSPFMPLYFTKFLGAPVEFYGALSSIYLLLVAGIALVSGKAIDLGGAMKTMIASFGLEAIAVFGMLLTRDWIVSGILFVIWESVDLLDITAPSILIGEQVDSRSRAFALSSFGLLSRLSKVPGPGVGAILFGIFPTAILVLELTVSVVSVVVLLSAPSLARFRKASSSGQGLR